MTALYHTHIIQASQIIKVTGGSIYEIGRQLAPLRDEGYLIFASGNVVHNLRRVEWDNPSGSEQTVRFNALIREKLLARDDKTVIAYEKLPDASYAVPTPEHYLPLIYVLGAAEGEAPQVFNDHCELGSIAMTGYAFGID